jgi:hypothetical protein
MGLLQHADPISVNRVRPKSSPVRRPQQRARRSDDGFRPEHALRCRSALACPTHAASAAADGRRGDDADGPPRPIGNHPIRARSRLPPSNRDARPATRPPWSRRSRRIGRTMGRARMQTSMGSRMFAGFALARCRSDSPARRLSAVRPGSVARSVICNWQRGDIFDRAPTRVSRIIYIMENGLEHQV